jgi:hypothetical protein
MLIFREAHQGSFVNVNPGSPHFRLLVRFQAAVLVLALVPSTDPRRECVRRSENNVSAPWGAIPLGRFED